MMILDFEHSLFILVKYISLDIISDCRILDRALRNWSKTRLVGFKILTQMLEGWYTAEV